MSTNLPNYSIEKAGDYDQTGTWRVNILTEPALGLVDRQLAGYVRPNLTRRSRPKGWQAIVEGVPIGSPTRTRALAVAVVLRAWEASR